MAVLAERYDLKVYVSRNSQRSISDLQKLYELCNVSLSGRYTLEVVDVVENPTQAENDHVMAVPTLIKLAPLPVRRIIGDLSDHKRMLSCLDITD